MYQRHYARAPIIEAVIDLQVRFDADVPLDVLYAFHAKLSGGLPSVHPIQLAEVGLASTGEQGLTFQSAHAVVGLRLAAADNRRVLQVQKKGFTYSHMPPYSNWATFSREARDLWDLFRLTCKPATVTRLAVRYINRIVIPQARAEPSEYLNIYAQLPTGIPQDVDAFAMQLQMPQPDLSPSTRAVINVALDEPQAPGSLAFLLDLDLFDRQELAPDDARVWEVLERLRVRKNELFEATITDKTRGLIQ